MYISPSMSWSTSSVFLKSFPNSIFPLSLQISFMVPRYVLHPSSGARTPETKTVSLICLVCNPGKTCPLTPRTTGTHDHAEHQPVTAATLTPPPSPCWQSHPAGGHKASRRHTNADHKGVIIYLTP